jgi:hypothetical protein
MYRAPAHDAGASAGVIAKLGDDVGKDLGDITLFRFVTEREADNHLFRRFIDHDQLTVRAERRELADQRGEQNRVTSDRRYSATDAMFSSNCRHADLLEPKFPNARGYATGKISIGENGGLLTTKRIKYL